MHEYWRLAHASATDYTAYGIPNNTRNSKGKLAHLIIRDYDADPDLGEVNKRMEELEAPTDVPMKQA